MERQLIANLTEKIRGSGSSREVLVKRVADALRDQIASGQLKAGARLMSEVALAENLEISRSTLREALRILVREGLVDIKHGVGAFVVDEHRLIWSRLELDAILHRTHPLSRRDAWRQSPQRRSGERAG